MCDTSHILVCVPRTPLAVVAAAVCAVWIGYGTQLHALRDAHSSMRWRWLVGSIELWVSFAKETYKRDYILQKRPIILSMLLLEATP